MRLSALLPRPQTNLLRLHPTSTPPAGPSCVGASETIDDSMAGIAIEYDGVSAPTLVKVDSFSYRSNDTIIMVSKQPDFSIGRGDNWSPHPAIIERGVADDIYTRSSTRLAGAASNNTYDVSFCIATSGANSTRTLTVTLVSIVQT